MQDSLNFISTIESARQHSPWKTQWKQIYSAMQCYKSQQKIDGPGLRIGLGLHQAQLVEHTQIETWPLFMGPQDIYFKKPALFSSSQNVKRTDQPIKPKASYSPLIFKACNPSATHDLGDSSVILASSLNIESVKEQPQPQMIFQLVEELNP